MLFRWLLNKCFPRTAGAPAVAPAPTPAAPVARPSAPVFTPKQWAMPAALEGFARREAFELPADALQALTERVAHLPRPPQDGQRFLSEDFLQRATATQLAEAILQHPHVAARLLAQVNAPLYGLSRPVSDVSSAIVFLGLDTVRTVAVQCLLEDALRPADARLRPLFDRWWRSSSLAGQLCLQLGRHVGVSDPGGMVTLAVLSFVGHMAALSLREPADTLRDGALDFLERTRAEQEALGLCAGELGCLMMAQWQMPAAIVEQVRAIDRVLVMPPHEMTPEQGLRTALTYYCARVAERFVSGQWDRVEQAMIGELEGAEFYHLQTHFMRQPRLAQLAADFQTPEWQASFDALLQRARA